MPAGGTGRIGVATVPAGRECCESHPDGKHRPAPLVHSTGHTRTPREKPVFIGAFGYFWSARYCGQTGAGKYNEPGVPDITGGVHTGGGSNDSFTGAFYGQDVSLITGQHPTSASTNSSNIFFAASRVSPVYGASDTVMPASFDVPVALYLGRPAEI